MPLDKSGTKEAFEKNVKTEIAAGKPEKQALAIAYAEDSAEQGLAAGVLFRAGDRVLLCKRTDNGLWAVPAGALEPGETAADAATREVFEETGYVISTPLALLYQSAMDGVPFTCFSTTCAPFTPILCDEHSEYMWALIDDLPQPMYPGLQSALTTGEMSAVMDYADTARQYDPNGYMEIKRNPISRVGVFFYKGSRIKGAPDPDALYAVLRPAEELSSPEAIESFKLQPWIDDHTMLGDGEGEVAPEVKGVQGVIGEQVFFDDETGILFGNVKLFSLTQQQKIDAGKKELSLGYYARFEYAPGVWNGIPYHYVMRDIRGNHLASVDDGRMGSEVAVMDGLNIDTSLEKEAMPTKTNGPAQGKPVNRITWFKKKLLSAVTDAEEAGSAEASELKAAVDVLVPALETIEELKSAVSGELAAEDEASDDMTTATTDAGEKPDGLVKEGEPTKDEDEDKSKTQVTDSADVDAKIAKAVAAALKAHGITAVQKAPIMDEAEVVARIAKKNTLVERLSHHVGVFDHSEMTLAQVAEYGVKTLGIPNVAKGQEQGAIEAYLHGRNAPSQRRHTSTAVTDGKDASEVSSYVASLNQAQ